MKRLLILPFIFCLLFIVGCQKDFETEHVKKFTRCEVPHQQKNVGDRQWYMSGFTPITACEASSINVYVDPCLHDTPYATAIPTGLQAYNDAPISVNFVLVKNPANADLTFFCTQGGCCGCANAAFPEPNNPGDGPPNDQTFFPSGGSIGSGISLAVNWDDCPCDANELTNCYFTRTVMHEIGHVLGLYHNDQVGVGAIHVNGTPTGNDPLSIINAGVDCNAPCTFSEYDLAALQLLYPIPEEVPELIGPDQACVGEQITFCANSNDYGQFTSVQWLNISPNTISVLNCATTTFNTPGYYTVEALITIEGNCEFIVSKDIIICDVSQIPTIPPIDFDEVCFGETVCYDFGSNPCLEGLTAVSSNPKLLVSVTNGTNLCLSYIHPKIGNATIQVTPTYGSCGQGATQTWDINLSTCDAVPGIPPITIGGEISIGTAGNNGGINAVDPATDCVTNNCPCHVDADCPPGFRCIGMKNGPRFCIPF